MRGSLWPRKYCVSPCCNALSGGMGQRRRAYWMSLLNINDARHLEHLAWVVYDGALLVGR